MAGRAATLSPPRGRENADLAACPVCGNMAPPGRFCGFCGYDWIGDGRRHRPYVAHPTGPVRRLELVSTLFPHLPQRATWPFRIVLLNGMAILALVSLLRLAAPSAIIAGTLLPALYLLYFWEVEVYEEEPWAVIGATLGYGAVVGVGWSLLFDTVATQAYLSSAGGQQTLAGILIAGIVPGVGQIGVLLGPALLFVWRRHREPLDGFAFGVAAALGFRLGITLVHLPGIASDGPLAVGDGLAFVLQTLRDGLLAPIVFACLAGNVALAFWSNRIPRRTDRQPPFAGPWFWAAVALAVQFLYGFANVLVLDTRLVVLTYVVGAAALLLVSRAAIHNALLDEAHEIKIGNPVICPHCLHVVPQMPFCPNCGVAWHATSKLARRKQHA